MGDPEGISWEVSIGRSLLMHLGADGAGGAGGRARRGLGRRERGMRGETQRAVRRRRAILRAPRARARALALALSLAFNRIPAEFARIVKFFQV